MPAPPIVVNLRGDAPFVQPAMIAALVAALRARPAAWPRLPVRLSWEALDALRQHKQVSPFSGTTCARRADGRACGSRKRVIRRSAAKRSFVRSVAFARCSVASACTPIGFDTLGRFEGDRADALRNPGRARAAPLPRNRRGYPDGRGRRVSRSMSGVGTLDDVAMAERLHRRAWRAHLSWT